MVRAFIDYKRDIEEPNGEKELFKVKILILGDERHPISIKIELYTDKDIFFLY